MGRRQSNPRGLTIEEAGGAGKAGRRVRVYVCLECRKSGGTLVKHENGYIHRNCLLLKEAWFMYHRKSDGERVRRGYATSD
jgi:hypothetical protein